MRRFVVTGLLGTLSPRSGSTEGFHGRAERAVTNATEVGRDQPKAGSSRVQGRPLVAVLGAANPPGSVCSSGDQKPFASELTSL